MGTPQRGDNVLSRSLKPLMRRAGLPEHNFQTDVATTMRIYQQAPDELQEKVAEMMGELLFGDAGVVKRGPENER